MFKEMISMENKETCTVHLEKRIKTNKGWSKKARKMRTTCRKLGISLYKPRVLVTAYYT